MTRIFFHQGLVYQKTSRLDAITETNFQTLIAGNPPYRSGYKISCAQNTFSQLSYDTATKSLPCLQHTDQSICRQISRLFKKKKSFIGDANRLLRGKAAKCLRHAPIVQAGPTMKARLLKTLKKEKS